MVRKQLLRAITYSLVLTTFLFLVALLVNISFDNVRISEIDYEHSLTILKAESYLLEQQLYEQYDRDFCPVLEERLWELEERLNDFSMSINVYRGQTFFLEDAFDVWKRKYIQSQINFFYLSEFLRTECGVETNIVLFFFLLDHEPSITQGFVLQDFRRETPGVVVLIFDLDYDNEPALDILKERHNISKEPVLVMPDGAHKPLITYIGEIRAHMN